LFPKNDWMEVGREELLRYKYLLSISNEIRSDHCNPTSTLNLSFRISGFESLPNLAVFDTSNSPEQCSSHTSYSFWPPLSAFSPHHSTPGQTCSDVIAAAEGDSCNQNEAGSCCLDYHNIAICEGTSIFETCGSGSVSIGGASCLGQINGGNAYCTGS
jgi:hypothetical protein